MVKTHASIPMQSDYVGMLAYFCKYVGSEPEHIIFSYIDRYTFRSTQSDQFSELFKNTGSAP